MLQRADKNAYSLLWASNIRNKQTKWIQSNLQEMEEKMKTMIKLIEVDADSFAKKAEMYYQRRPELIKFVEETYKAYKALADRYDHMSGELHKANHTLASAFPDQFQFAMQDDDDGDSPSGFTAIDASKFRKTLPGEVPQINLRNKRPDASSALKNYPKNVSSHITKENTQKEVDRLQREILVLQTEKEFVKGSYESGLAKYWEIVNRITDFQDQICTLQGQFSASSVVEDDEARALMAATAIKSCEESLMALQEQLKKSGEEAEIESKRIREANGRLKFLKGEKLSPETENFDKETNGMEQSFDLKNEGLDLDSFHAQVKQQFQRNSMTSIDLGGKINELVEKVISLEVTVSSHKAQIQTLRSETDGLQKHLLDLEEDKANSITDTNSLILKLRLAEDEFHRVQELEKAMHHEKNIFQSHFKDAYNSLNDISEKLQSPRCVKDSSSTSSNFENMKKNEVKEMGAEDVKGDAAALEDEVHVKHVESNAKDSKDQSHYGDSLAQSVNNSEKMNGEDLTAMVSSLSKDVELNDRGNIPDWHQLLNNGAEGRQKMLIYEYMSILQKDRTKMLTEIEKKNQEYDIKVMAQIEELQRVIAIKDQEIRHLKRKLLSQTGAASSLKQGQTLNEEGSESPTQELTTKAGPVDTEEEVKLCYFEERHSTSPIEEKFRAELDTLLDENLDFWLRFSTSYHRIQKFEASFKELRDELDKLGTKEGQSAPAFPNHSSMQDMTLLDKKMRELHTEIQVWMEQNALLKKELQCRFTSLRNIQEEISKASRDTEGEDFQFTPYLVAKLQGELLNMQQENDKVAKELQTGFDHVKELKSEVAKSLSKLRESFDLSASNGYHEYQNFRHSSTRSKVPLRTFLFGEKRKKPSIFSCMSPVMHRNHNQIKPMSTSR